MAQVFSVVFLVTLAADTALRLWLAVRHLRCVRAHRDSVPAPFSASIPIDAHRRAADYTGAKLRLALAQTGFSALFLLALTRGGVLQALFDFWSSRLAPQGHAHGIAFVISVVALGFLADLPFTLYRTFVIEQRFGFNRTAPQLFVIDLIKQAALAAAIGAPLLLAVLWLMGHMGAAWWLYVWIAWLGFNLLVLLIYPTWIAPLFNEFAPLADAQLAARIDRLMERCGMRPAELFVMDGSKRSAHGNAYFTGFGAARRVVFFDTLIARLQPQEIEAVLAHELGHYRLRHVWKRVALIAAASLAFLWSLGILIGEPWFYLGLGMHGQSTAVALTLFALVLPVFTFPLQPVAGLLSRRHEFEADAFAARLSSGADLASALVKLYRDNAATLTPDPLYSAFHDSHPPAGERIARLLGRSAEEATFPGGRHAAARPT